MILYHGSPTKITGRFLVSDRYGSQSLGPGMYCSPDKFLAMAYCEGDGYLYQAKVDPICLGLAKPDPDASTARNQVLHNRRISQTDIKMFIKKHFSYWDMDQNVDSYNYPETIYQHVMSDMRYSRTKKDKIIALYTGLWAGLTFKNQSENQEFFRQFSAWFRCDFIWHNDLICLQPDRYFDFNQFERVTKDQE